MIIHDLLCHVCGYEAVSVPVVGGNFPTHCGRTMDWIPSGFVTDVRGSEQVSHVLCEPDNPSMPLKWTSSRERDAKMAKQGFVPAGDRVNGAIGNSDPAKGRSYVFASDKGSVRSPKR
jgi:hypothetical protein